MDGDQAQTIYWIRDDDGGTIGIDVSKSATMVIEMDGGSISVIKGYQDINETLYPESDLKDDARKLAGFKWHDQARPKDKNDIFRKAEAVMPQVVSSETQTETSSEPEAKVEQPKRHRERKDINSN